jgi:hypothetical protein
MRGMKHLVALVASLVALSSCTVVQEEAQIGMSTVDGAGPCRDLELGAEARFYANVPSLNQYIGIASGVFIPGSDDFEEEHVWALSGAGELDPVVGFNPRFVATEIGENAISVIVYATGFRLFGLGDIRLPVVQVELAGNCSFAVVEDLTEPTISSLPPGTLAYDVRSVVLASDMGGAGSVTNTQWTFSFAGCTDGRCDADIVAGTIPFSAVFTENDDYVFEQVDEGGCTVTRAGSIEPVEWSDVGPLEFVARWTSTSRCRGAEPVVVEWESAGTLR